MKKIFEIEWDESLLVYRDTFIQEAMTAFYGKMFKVTEIKPEPSQKRLHPCFISLKKPKIESLDSQWSTVLDDVVKKQGEIIDRINEL